MQLNSFPVILAEGTQTDTNPIMAFMPMILLVVIFYFILIRPQQKRAKEQRLMLEKLKAGDKVITSAGIIGEVITVKDRTVSLRSADAKMEVTKESVVAITEPKP